MRLEPSGLIGSWACGWAASRGYPAPVSLGCGVRVDCGRSDRPTEFVAYGDAAAVIAELAQLAAAVPGAWLTVPTPHPRRTTSALIAHGAELRSADEVVMSRKLGPSRVTVPEGFTVEEQSEGGVRRVFLFADTGASAASGQLGLVSESGSAVFDKIETHESFRRRGLGSTVMGLLTEAALCAGVDRGLLISSAMGQHLYRSLGWEAHTRLVVGHRFAGPGHR